MGHQCTDCQGRAAVVDRECVAGETVRSKDSPVIITGPNRISCISPFCALAQTLQFRANRRAIATDPSPENTDPAATNAGAGSGVRHCATHRTLVVREPAQCIIAVVTIGC